MRTARQKMVGKGCWYHLINRISGPQDELLFTDVDKEVAFKLFEEISNFYLIEIISITIMSNHFHCVCYAPEEAPSLEEAAQRHNSYYGNKKPALDAELQPERCEDVARQMIDISHFMAVFQQRYACYINRTHKRRGRLWSNRFKSTILQGLSAVWNCVKYVELNPVRAHIVEDPADYRFCTWGRFSGSGEHPFMANFAKHMKQSWAYADTTDWSFDDVCREFRGELTRIIASERGVTGQELLDEVEKARKGESMPVKFLRRTRHWGDGAIIGSKAFVQEIGCMFEDKDRVMRKVLSRGVTPNGDILHCFRRLTV